MRRRRYLIACSGSLGGVALSGCTGIFPTDSDSGAQYPGGTLVVENAAESALTIEVTVADGTESAAFETEVAAGETVVEREFVTASQGTVVTLSAVIGNDGEPTTFEFLPGGGGDDAPPEVAHLTIENPVEESATWLATAGTE